MSERCETCRFWEEYGDSAYDDGAYGACRRYAPRPGGSGVRGRMAKARKEFEDAADEWHNASRAACAARKKSGEAPDA